MTISLRDVFLLTGLPITGEASPVSINPASSALPIPVVSSQDFSSYASVAKKLYNLKADLTLRILNMLSFYGCLFVNSSSVQREASPQWKRRLASRSVFSDWSSVRPWYTAPSTYHSLRKCATEDPALQALWRSVVCPSLLSCVFPRAQPCTISVPSRGMLAVT